MKERMIMVLVPIKDSDATGPIYNSILSLSTAVPPTENNINNIYRVRNAILNRVDYYRAWLNPLTNQYEYHVVVDREFPYLGKPLEIFDFTYDATRMGSAPTITAQGVMWYADKDENNNDVTLEDLWLARNNDCHVSFNGENFYLKQVPTCSKDNEDARYKYDIDFVSERIVLENVYLYDVVQPFVTERPISESAQFSFFGDVSELAKRINASLLRSGLAKLELRDNQSETVHPRLLVDGITHAADDQFFTYDEWNAISVGNYSGPLSTADPYSAGEELPVVHKNVFDHYGGDYNAYLRNEVYLLDSDGEMIMSGYIVKIGKDKKGELTTSEEKLITFDKNTIHEALQEVHDKFGLQYYIYSEKNSDGDFTGNTIIMIADCEHDFADVTGTDADGNPIYSRDADGIPTTEHPFDYGVDNELLFKEKTNTTDKIITRITGIGSEENIPWYYPNPTADGWIKPIYSRGDTALEEMVEYPLSEEPDNALYEKYIKNRLGFEYLYKKLIESHYLGGDVAQLHSSTASGGYTLSVVFEISVGEAFHLEASNILNRYNGDEPTQIVISKRQTDGSYSNVAIHNVTTLPITEFETGYYRVSVNFQFSERPARNEFRWYYVPVPSNVTSSYAYPLLVDASKITEEEVMSLHIEENQNYPSVYWWYYTDRNGVNKVAYGFAFPPVGTDNIESECQQAGFFALFNGVQYKPDDACKIFTDLSQPDGGWDGKYYKVEISSGEIVSMTEILLSDEEIYQKYITGTLGVYTKHWTRGNKNIELSDFGLSLTGAEAYGDSITFQRVKYITPQPTLMPEVYVKTDGERRFYNAVNYPLSGGTPDSMIGEEESGGQIINPLYYKEDSTTHFDFENEYIKQRPHEHIEQFEDVKPSIKGQINTVDGQSFRIDVVEEFAYDELDDDDVWENNDNGNISGEYKHPYFFAKLRPLGFNIFDLALQEDMVLSMTTGHCGACNFKIGVDENTKKNPVQIWEYDVYEGADYATKVLKYNAGTLRRVVDTSNLYYDKTPGDESGYVLVDTSSNIRAGFLVPSSEISLSRSTLFERRVYSAIEVRDGLVGSLKMDNRSRFAGDVVTSGRFIESQQDTSENYVWVALYKDTDTYGVLMPSARPDYGDNNYSVYIRPKSVADTTDEDTADNFVLTNIRMPQAYLRRAERELSRRIVAYMYDNNFQKFNFSIKFSRIFLAQNLSIDDDINENSVLYVSFNNRTYRQYVKHYTYRMTKGEVLPEIDVDMNEELSVSRTQTEREANARTQAANTTARRMRSSIESFEERISRRTIGRNQDTLVSGNLVSRDAVTSFSDLQTARRDNEARIFDTQLDLEVNHFKKGDFVLSEKKLQIGDSISVPSKNIFDALAVSVNTFNAGVKQRINQIRRTVEYRLPSAAGGGKETGCDSYKYDFNEIANTSTLLWLNEDGTRRTISADMCYDGTNMTDIEWKNIDTTE